MNHIPTVEINMIFSLCPFAKWGLDIVGLFVLGRGDVKYVLVATDYFTKWVEVKSYKMIFSEELVSFM